jgi:hypothetical protein
VLRVTLYRDADPWVVHAVRATRFALLSRGIRTEVVTRAERSPTERDGSDELFVMVDVEIVGASTPGATLALEFWTCAMEAIESFVLTGPPGSAARQN